MNVDNKYTLTSENEADIEEAAQWFLGSRKPRTASEVRNILLVLYGKGLIAGVRAAIEEIKDL